MFRKPAVQELTPAEVDERLRRKEITLIDVREPQEHLLERIECAVLVPLSSFNPREVPAELAGAVVFYCAAGRRSAVAVARCIEAGVPATMHMKGGLAAWKAARLPTLSGRPAEAAVVPGR